MTTAQSVVVISYALAVFSAGELLLTAARQQVDELIWLRIVFLLLGGIVLPAWLTWRQRITTWQAALVPLTVFAACNLARALL